MTLSIGGIGVGGNNPCRTVAELSNNHNGDLARCLRLITAAKDAGADIIKLQCYTPDELVALRGDGPAPAQWGEQGWTMRALYEKARTPFDWFPVIAEYCRDLEIPWFSSVFGKESLALLESLDCPAYKTARLDIRSYELRAPISRTRKPTIGSFGPRDTLPVFEARDLNLWCPEGYPQTDLGLHPHLWQYDGDYEPMFDGFSYHGTDPLACVTAATLGAKIIEAHFQLADEPSELEANISLNEHQWRRMVDDIRRVEEMLA